VVLQLHNYNSDKQWRDTTGFSRWYFNFTAKNEMQQTAWTPPDFSRWYFNFTTTHCAAYDVILAKLSIRLLFKN